MSETSEKQNLEWLVRLFDRIVLGHPIPVLIVVLGITAFFTYHLKDFKLDASSDSIVLENDEDLRYYNASREKFGSDDYVVVTVTPSGDLFSDATLDQLASMVAEFEKIESVEGVLSIMSVPLFESPEFPSILLLKLLRFKTIQGEGSDKALAKKELVSSPLYNDYLISTDGKTCAVQVNFKPDQQLNDLYNERARLRDARRDGTLDPEGARRLAEVTTEYSALHAENSVRRAEDIARVRQIMKDHASIGELYVGGVPMIVADIISYVRNDIIVFGIGVFIFLIVMLALIFRKIKWVLLPIGACAITVLIMMGYLGFVDWKVTIVTSNFTSLLLILTISMAIHIVVRYRELYARNPELSNRELTREAACLVARPSLYCALTTIVGFSSLVVSGIRPVMDFGLMMAMGLGVGFLVCFIFLPAALMLFPKGSIPPAKLAKLTGSPVAVMARFTERHRWVVAGSAAILFAICLWGALNINVENRFIDYFKADTPIYQGMTIIDERLGGTTPLEVVLIGEGKDYWLQLENLDRLREIHTFLDELPETGKVISLDTMRRVVEKVNKGEPIGQTTLNLVKSQLPEDLRAAVLKPYATEDFSETRIAMRVRESSRDLQRGPLIERINAYLGNDSHYAEDKYHVTGMFVLYNNMLQSLVRSQIKTIGMVFLAIWIMFLILFRSPTMATIAIIPNILPVVLVLGIMGLSGIPLDMMTVMTAAVTMGIAVDDTVHYIHRFQSEFPVDRDYKATMYRCHNSIGRAMYYTTLMIFVGFSILTLSNFIPTIYFGVFTGLAMLVALLAAVTLLPLLIISWKPLGPEGVATEKAPAA